MTAPCHDTSEGFILLEILVALTILAVAFGFAFDALSGGLGWIGRARQTQDAISLAQATLARVGHDIPLHDGRTRGRDGDAFGWQLDIAPYDDTSRPVPGGLVAYRVTVSVRWAGSRRPEMMRLATIRLGPKDATP